MAGLEKDLAQLGIPTAMVMREGPGSARPSAYIRERGTFTSPGELVYANVPSAFNPLPKGVTPNRLALARWLVSDDNPLTARVTVNHFWETLSDAAWWKPAKILARKAIRPRILNFLIGWPPNLCKTAGA